MFSYREPPDLCSGVRSLTAPEAISAIDASDDVLKGFLFARLPNATSVVI